VLLSTERQFLFIHVPKTGGTSIEAALKQFAVNGISDILTGHATAADLRGVIQDWSKYFKFGFVRNPWAAQVSMYNYVMARGKSHPDWPALHACGGFSEYIQRHLMQSAEEGKVRTQSDFLLCPRGKLLVDFVGRFERLDIDFRAACKLLGLGEISLPRLNGTQAVEHRAYYDRFAYDVVKRIFARDIDEFGYPSELV
jgi:Sulfotransferase family